MKRFSSISYQLFGFLLLAVLVTGVLFFLSLSHNQQTRDFLAITKQDSLFLNQIKEVRYHFSFARKEEKNWILFQNPSYLESRKKSLGRSFNLLADLKKSLVDSQYVEPLESLESRLLNYMSLGNELAQLPFSKRVSLFTDKAKTLDEEIGEQVTEISDLLLLQIDKNQKTATEGFQKYFQYSVIMMAGGLALLITIGTFWIRRFRRRLDRLTKATQRMALGDYTPKLNDTHADEIGILSASFSEMVAKIAEREEKIDLITQELIHANNLLKKEPLSIHQVPKIRI